MRTGWIVLAVVCGLWDLCLPVVPQEANNRLAVQTNRVLQMSRDLVNSSGRMISVSDGLYNNPSMGRMDRIFEVTRFQNLASGSCA